ncbi:MAG: sigma-70 family RNA polymerase sigma factor [Planctomycetes bacterium]|nr:sigma-70 family RNA polymerase sigma factor [Planctomycetota bacterium]
MDEKDQEFVANLTQSQSRLLGYLVSLLGNIHDAQDVLQATNMALWKVKDEFRPGADFGPWSRKFAHFQTLAFIRDRKRDRHIFNEELLELIATEEVDLGGVEERLNALRNCLLKLPADKLEMIKSRYKDGGCIKDVAQMVGKKEATVRVSLLRIRQALLKCIESKLNFCQP